MVAHIWANRSQDDARTSTHNFYFVGPTLFSYGRHFVVAHHLENGRILWNDASYSNTTAKHKAYARQALKQNAWQNAIYAPGLSDDAVRNLERVRREGFKKGQILPDAIADCAGMVRRNIAKMGALGRAPKQIADCWSTAKRYEKSGRELCAYIQETSKARIVWPVAALPEQCPEKPEERAELARIVACFEIFSAYAKHCERFGEYCRAIHDALENRDPAIQYRAHADRLRDMASNAGLALHGAAVNYKNAHGRSMPGLKQKSEALQALQAQVQEYVFVVYVEHGKREFSQALRYAAKLTHAGAIAERNKWASDNVDRMRTECARLLGFRDNGMDSPDYSPFVARIQRMADWHDADKMRERFKAQIVSGNAWLDGVKAELERGNDSGARIYASNAAREFKNAYALGVRLKNGAPEKWRSLYGAQIAQELAPIAYWLECWKAQEQERERQAIADWISGASNVRPSAGVGTFARIKGENVETSRGAIVPLAHACRLARIARRVIAQGGKYWPQGEGPIVGHFRVSSIAADGASVIGCHEFDGAESLRMLALLDACPTCKGETEGGE